MGGLRRKVSSRISRSSSSPSSRAVSLATLRICGRPDAAALAAREKLRAPAQAAKD
jgi:hypothetical protein